MYRIINWIILYVLSIALLALATGCATPSWGTDYDTKEIIASEVREITLPNGKKVDAECYQYEGYDGWFCSYNGINYHRASEPKMPRNSFDHRVNVPIVMKYAWFDFGNEDVRIARAPCRRTNARVAALGKWSCYHEGYWWWLDEENGRARMKPPMLRR